MASIACAVISLSRGKESAENYILPSWGIVLVRDGAYEGEPLSVSNYG